MEGSPEVRITIAPGSQAERFLEQCEADEYHRVRGLLLLISTAPEADGDRIITLDRPPLVFRVYQDESYRITFYMENRNSLIVAYIQRV